MVSCELRVEALQHYFGRIAVVAILVLPFTRLQGAFEIHFRALLQILLGDLAQALVEDYHAMPFDLLASLASSLVAPAFQHFNQGAYCAARHGPDAPGQERESKKGIGREGHGAGLGLIYRQRDVLSLYRADSPIFRRLPSTPATRSIGTDRTTPDHRQPILVDNRSRIYDFPTTKW
jgi:hypothetical protein